MSLITGLYRDYGNFRVDIPKWQLNHKGISALWGPSGSGKTSVIRLLCGLEPCPTLTWKFEMGARGEVDLARLSNREKRLGVVFQSYELFWHLSGKDNLHFAAKARGLNAKQTADCLKELG